MTISKVRGGETISVGYIIWPPNVMKDPNSGELSGQMVDAINFIASEAGLDLEWREVGWSTFIAELENRTIDIMVSGAYVTIPRSKTVAFTRPIFYLGIAVVMGQNDYRFQSLTDINQEGVVIAATLGTAEYTWAEKNLPNATLQATAGSDLTLPLVEVLNGTADIGITDTYNAEQFAAKHDNVRAVFTDKPFNLTPIGWAVRQEDHEWKDFLDVSLEYLELTEKMTEFERRYDAPWLHKVNTFK